MKPIYDAGLSRANIVRSLSRAVVHGPRDLYGLALPNLFVESGIYKIDRLCRLGSSEQFITGFLLRETVEYLTLELGLSGNVFDNNYQIWHKLATDCWAKYVWMFLRKYNISVRTATPPLETIRDADVILMEQFYKFGFRRDGDLVQLNECRKFLHAISLADLCNVKGTHIREEAWKGVTATGSRPGPWPKSPPTKALNWTLWQIALKSTFGLDRYHRVAIPLGRWKDVRQLQLWFYSPAGDKLLHQNRDKSWDCHHRANHNRGKPQFRAIPSSRTFAVALLGHGNIYTADVSAQGDKLVLKNHDDRQSMNLHVVIPTGPKIKEMDKLGWIADVWYTDHANKEVETIAQAIREKKCEAVSDGSAFDANEGSAAWCIGQTGTFEIVSAGLRVHGPDDSQCSYRSELAGVYAILLTIWAICHDTGVTNGAIEIGTDSEGVIKRLFWSTTPAHLGDHSYDLLSACQRLLRKLHFLQFTARHIPGHQDEKFLPEKGLDVWADRNIEMDARAGKIYTQIPKSQMTEFQASDIWQIKVNNQVVIHNFRQQVRKATVGRDIMKYWEKEGKLGQRNTEIAWESVGMAMSEIPNKKRRWIVKHTAGRCAVGVEMKRRRTWTHSKCPRCAEQSETATHVLQCPGEGTETIWEKAIADLRQWLVLQRTNNQLTELLCTSLTAWRHGHQVHPPTGHLRELRTVFDAQTDIGWGAALEGRLSIHWINIQERHFSRIKTRKSAKRWMAALIQKMWAIAWELWEHRNSCQQERATEEQRAKNSVNIRYEFGLGNNGLDSKDRKLFNSTMAEILQSKLSLQDSWIRRVTRARKRAATNIIHWQQQSYLDFYHLLHNLWQGRNHQTTPTPTTATSPSIH